MRLLRSIAFFIYLFCLAGGLSAQESPSSRPLSNLRSKLLPVEQDRISVDSLSIIPGSFYAEAVDSADYRLDYVNAVLYWVHKPAEPVKVQYRVFPVKLNPVVQRMQFDSLVLNSAAPIAPPEATEKARQLFNFGNINAQGSFGRQMGFGNNQSLVLNSNLNVQLSGMLADSIELQAAITDNNIPIQPDGNTQQLNEFDEVYIRFKKKNWQLNIGDLDLRENRSYFLNFYKRLQGVSFQTDNYISKKTSSNTLISGSIAKGKFTRNVFQGLEGNQGPYKLQGANNEFFFIVLANTERVFIDGELLQRGEDQDYVINYNTAEVSFTPRRMITKDSRIQIEFEYADRNFLNTNVYGMQELNFNDKVKLRVGFFNNSDAKNSSINQVLDNRQKQFLSQIGDSIQNALYPSAVPDTFAAGKVLYALDYLMEGTTVIDSFYRYSVNRDSAKYNVSFMDVGFGKGDYVADINSANGKVFQYVAPVNGQKQGNFAPVMALVTPKKQQVLTLGVDYALTKNTLLKTEVAASSYDVNTFSRVDNGDDKGFAAKVNLSNTAALSSKNNLRLISAIDYEMVQSRFQPVERLRSVEFTRDWGLPLVTARVNENIIRASAELKNEKGNSLQYRFTNYNRSDRYNGFQNALTQFTQWKNWTFNNDVTITNYSGALDKGYFLRPVLDISKKIPALDNWSVGARYTLERNESRNSATDTLNATAFSFDTYTFFLKSDEARQNRYGISFYTREDQYPVQRGFIKGDRSYNLNLTAELLSNKNRQLYMNTTLRRLKVNDAAVSHQQEENSILSRLEYNMNEFKGFLTGNVLYEVGSGQEQKREYAYLEVPAGTGQYTWIDLNQDSVQQLNEFELAAFPDQARFIRINTPTNEYIKANYNTLNYSLGFNPRLLWNEKTASGLQKFAARFNLTSTLQVSRKAQATGPVALNPFRYGLNDTNLITMSSVLVNTLSFNRLSTVWGIDISNLQNTGKSLLTYGYESRKTKEWSVKYRHFFGGNFTFNLDARNGVLALYSDNSQFDNRNYEIRKNSAEPSVSFISGTTFRVMAGYKYEIKKNRPDYGGEKAVSNALTAETKYNILQSAAVTARFTLDNLNYQSAASNTTTVSYIMLDGLLPGKNYLWNIMLTKRLMSNLELNFQYDGRKPGTTKTIHTGKASLTAIF
ncbi:hypothetical protein [Niabella beijingensis]|uniref:hypothetical protein n=1 Tax=Niabella beijingensis TaxID=2872700 RepID=UPI001CBB7E20|nr:hypothetical protein [Niabella beijingensis]